MAEPLPLLAGNHKLHKEGGGVLKQQLCRPRILDQLGNGRESPLTPLSYKLACCEYLAHRIFRVPGFLSSRPNLVPSPPHPQWSVAPAAFGFRGKHTRSRGRGWWDPTQFRRRDRHSGTLCMLILLLPGSRLVSRMTGSGALEAAPPPFSSSDRIFPSGI